MFKNIAGKIKVVAKVSTIIGIIASCILAFPMITSPNGDEMFIGFMVLIGGPLLSWIASFITYGFAEIIDLLTEIRNSLNGGEPKKTVIGTSDVNVSDNMTTEAEEN